jgi:hypothetical protein
MQSRVVTPTVFYRQRLPIAQLLDYFLRRVSLGGPSRDDETVAGIWDVDAAGVVGKCECPQGGWFALTGAVMSPVGDDRLSRISRRYSCHQHELMVCRIVYGGNDVTKGKHS